MPPKPAKDQTKSTPTSKRASLCEENVKNPRNDNKKEPRSLFEDETSKTAAQIPVSDSETLIKDLLEQNKRLIVENSELKEQIKKLTKEIEQQRNEIQKLHAVEETNTKLNEKIKKLEETQSQKENTDSKQIEEKMKDIEYLKERLYEAEKNNLDLKKQIEELQKTQLQEKERKKKPSAEDKKNSDLTKKIKDLENERSQLEQERKDTLSRIEKLMLESEFEELQKTLSQKEKENKSKLEEKDKENSKLSELIYYLQTDVAQLQKANKKLMEEKNKAVREVDNLKNRPLGSKIYRPVELAERFSEVYDNEWTDALEELLEKINNEKAVIQILLHIVMDAYQFCTEKAETFYGSLKGAVSQTFKTMTLTDSQLKVMNGYRIATAEHLVTNLQEEFCRANKFDEGSVTHYQKACIRVCWLMTVQDPPVFMDCKENATGAKFDSDKYKCFTKEGNVVDYIVWPVLYLHKGGPMISKGIAQKK